VGGTKKSKRCVQGRGGGNRGEKKKTKKKKNQGRCGPAKQKDFLHKNAFRGSTSMGFGGRSKARGALSSGAHDGVPKGPKNNGKTAAQIPGRGPKPSTDAVKHNRPRDQKTTRGKGTRNRKTRYRRDWCGVIAGQIYLTGGRGGGGGKRSYGYTGGDRRLTATTGFDEVGRRPTTPQHHGNKRDFSGPFSGGAAKTGASGGRAEDTPGTSARPKPPRGGAERAGAAGKTRKNPTKAGPGAGFFSPGVRHYRCGIFSRDFSKGQGGRHIVGRRNPGGAGKQRPRSPGYTASFRAAACRCAWGGVEGNRIGGAAGGPLFKKQRRCINNLSAAPPTSRGCQA